MESIFQISLHEELKKTALSRLSKKKIYLEKKANDTTTSQVYKDLLLDEIEDFEMYVESAENIITTYQELIEEIGNQKFSLGYKKGCKDGWEAALGGIPNKYFDKEQFRAYHELTTKNKWDDHY